MSIASISSTGDFTQTNNCGTGLSGGGGTCTIQITFTPTTIGARTDEISIADNAPGSPHQIIVTGTGVLSSVGSLTITPTSLTFPTETVGVASPAQVIHLANAGQSAITLSDITVTGDFAETNTCGTFPSVLNVGDGCTISVIFTPTSSGKLTGNVTILDNASSGAQSVSLAGTGNPVFSLSVNNRSAVVQIGTYSTTFTVSATAPSSFVESITLACSQNASCIFDPPTITGGESSTLTLGGLRMATNPFNVTVSGKTTTQTASVALAVFQADFSLTASPTLNSVTAGNSAPYTVTITPTNGFSGVVLLGCGNLPNAATCSWAPRAVTLNGSVITAKVTINTTAQSGGVGRLPRGPVPWPLGRLPIGARVLWLLAFSVAAISFAGLRGRRRSVPAPLAVGLRLAVLAMALLVAAAGTGCNTTYTGLSITPVVKGTPSGVFHITVTGTLGNDSTVQRSTTINLSVSP